MYPRALIFLIITLITAIPCLPAAWTNPTPDTLTSYVYAPPVLSTEIFMSKYCPRFEASTGEIITCSKGIEVIGQPASSGNLAETRLKSSTTKGKCGRKQRRLQRKLRQKNEPTALRILTAPLRAICHTITSIAQRIFGIKVKKNKKRKSQTESLDSYWIDLKKVNLAQQEDLDLFAKIFDQHKEKVMLHEPSKKHGYVLYGTSRGSATVFNYMALNNPANVRAVICDGLFDSIEHVYHATSSSKIRFLITLIRQMTNFKDDGILPINVVDKIPLDIPMLLVTSRKDRTVPWECTMNIYQQLRARGHKKVHILIMKKAPHAMVPRCNKRDKKLYENVAHAFYKHYGLPYIEEYAHAGKEYFEGMSRTTEQNRPDLKV